MEKQEDGWDSLSESSDSDCDPVGLYRENEGRSILHQQYSLEPDMFTGWMPKLPSCPIPLTYHNPNTQQICDLLARQQLYEVAYRGERSINSVQLHQRYNYRWKYRERYDVKLSLIAEAVTTVGLTQNAAKMQAHSSARGSRQELVFDSSFESGNLDLAVRVRRSEYDCFMRSDTNTKGHTNWFYFRVSNGRQVGAVQLNICNIVKRRNLYGKGMNPYCRVVEPGTKPSEWSQQHCYDTQFVERLCRYGTGKTANHLQFKFDFSRENMEVYFAYSIPYTYSDLLQFLEDIKPHPYVKISTACESFSGLELPLLSISSGSCQKKASVVMTARIHPGETNSSHMLEGFVRALLAPSTAACRLLAACNFYVLPMMNPDGVAAGNYRTSFSGRDLNRQFDQIGSFLYPEVNGLVALVQRLKKQRQRAEFFFDFHSHSSKKNLFCYGPDHAEGSPHCLRSRVLVKILSKQDSMFDYEKCISSISEHKRTTARAYMIRKQAVPMTFTFEVSNGLYSLTKQLESAFDRASLHRAGTVIFQGLSEYSSFYLRELDTKSAARLSLNLSKKQPVLKKVTARRSQNLSSSFEQLSAHSHELKEIIEELTQENLTRPPVEERYSDHEESDNDMEEADLRELFDVRRKYMLDLEGVFGQEAQQRNISRKSSMKLLSGQSTAKHQLTKAASEKALSKLSLNVQKKLECNLVAPTCSTPKPGKYKKNRIYYQETHPPSTKKVVDNPNALKRALKQKRFPIIF